MMRFFSPSKWALTNGPTSQPTQQLPPQPALSVPPKSQSHTSQQQQQPLPVQPWSVHRLNALPPTLSENALQSGPPPSPFSRSSFALSSTASAAGELFIFGGVAHKFPCNDLYVFSTGDLSATPLKTSGEVPGPRYAHACARIGDALLIWGGVTNTDDQGLPIGPYDDSLYLLSLVSREWTRVVVKGHGPVGRYYHAATTVGSKLFVFGGMTPEKSSNDMWAFDVSSVKSNPVWDSYEPPRGGKKPPPRNGHVLVTTGDYIILFGGAKGQHYYNDTWLFDVSTRTWTELQCAGCTPSPRAGHAAALVDDVMYVFGGRVGGSSVDDLLAFKLSTQRWFTFQSTGPSPSRRWRHAMACDGTRVFVLGGSLSEMARGDETTLIHVMDTKHTKYPSSDRNSGKLGEETTQLPWKSSSSPPAQEEDDDSEGSAVSRAKFTVPDAPLEGNVAQLELERQLSATLAALTERDQRLAQLTDELHEQTSLVEQKDAELLDMRAKLDELLLSRDQHVGELEQALRKETSRAADADERSQRACERYKTELEEVRAELGARKSELEAVRCLRFTNAEDNGLAKSNTTEADTWRAPTTAGLVSTDDDRITREIVERIRAEMALLRLSEKSSEAIQSSNEGQIGCF